MQNLVIMNLAVWNGSWSVGHHFQFWQIFSFSSEKHHYSFFIVNIEMGFFQPEVSEMYLVYTDKVILAYI